MGCYLHDYFLKLVDWVKKHHDHIIIRHKRKTQKMKPSGYVTLQRGDIGPLAVSSGSSSRQKVLQLQLITATKKQSCSSAWLEHYTDNVGVSSSNLLGTTLLSSSSG